MGRCAKYHHITLCHLGRTFRLRYFLRPGPGQPLLFLHGLGGSAAHFEQAIKSKALDEYTLISLNFPGSDGSTYYEDRPLSIDDLVLLMSQFTVSLDLSNLVLVGHSMGGLVALLYSLQPDMKVQALVSIEGNLAPEDCRFVSRKIASLNRDAFEHDFLPGLIRRWANVDNAGIRQYAQELQTVHRRSYFDYCPSIVSHSGKPALLNSFLGLDLPRLFIYGSENADLTYLSALKTVGCQVVEIKNSNHFPHLDAPEVCYQAIATFLKRHAMISSLS